MAEETKSARKSRKTDTKNNKSILIIVIIIILIGGIVYFMKSKNAPEAMEKDETTEIVAEDTDAQLDELRANLGTGSVDKEWSYATGYIFGSQILGSLAQSGDGAILDADEVALAISDLLTGNKTKLSVEEVETLIQDRQAAEAKINEELAASNQATGEEAKTAFEAGEDVVTNDDGALYKVLAEGEGEVVGDKVAKVLYTGTKLDGTVFDSTANNDNQPVAFQAAQLIPGVGSPLSEMKAGDKWEIFVPVELGYGLQIQPGGPIGPNEALKFELEVVEILAPAETEAQ